MSQQGVKMKLRQLGKTGLNVSEIGYGAWGIGKFMWVGAEDDVSLQALQKARELGINFFDTALAYGTGESERLLARAFGKNGSAIIASKVPPKNLTWPAKPGTPLAQAFPKSYVLRCLDQSLHDLGRESIEIYQFHVWSDEWATQPEWLETVREMRKSGKVRHVGISINDHQPSNSLKALETGLVDVVQVIYNIFDQSPEDELFPYCVKHKIGVIARVPFDEGSLTGKVRPETTFPAGDFRNQYFAGERKQQVWERVERMVKDVGISLDELPQFALRSCLSHPAVSTVIPGMRRPAHVAANAPVSDMGPLPAATLAKLRKHRWIRNFYA
jgi:aryl-alcohol dehydrogenase-like predicted oxidoreductase